MVQCYEEKVEGHQRHAFRNYLLFVYTTRTPKPESEIMRVFEVSEDEEIASHANRGGELPRGLGPVPKEYVGSRDETPEFIESDEEDLELMDVTTSPLSDDGSQETSLTSLPIGKNALMQSFIENFGKELRFEECGQCGPRR